MPVPAGDAICAHPQTLRLDRRETYLDWQTNPSVGAAPGTGERHRTTLFLIAERLLLAAAATIAVATTTIGITAGRRKEEICLRRSYSAR